MVQIESSIPDDPSILEREPEIISQFVVNPQVDTTLESLTGSLSEFIGVEDDSYFIEVPDGQIDEFFDWDANYPQLISAHRGGFLPGFPENAIATFENTLTTAPALLEVDVRRTADGEWILMHDDDLERTTTGTGLVEETTLAEIQTLQLKDNDGNLTPYKVPTLQEAILWAEGKTILELDLKSDDYASEVAEIITELDGEDQVRFITQDIEQATEVYNINPEIHLGVFVIPENQEEVFAEIESAPFTLDKISAFTGTQPQSAEFYDSLHDEGIVAIQGLFGEQDTFDSESIDDLSNEQQDTLFNTVFDNGADAIAADYYQQIASLIGYPAPEDINVLDIEPDIIDLTSFTAEVSAVNDTGFENIGGFYQASDNKGTVIDPMTGAEVAVGDVGYKDAALANSVVEIGDRENTAVEFDGGFTYVPYLLADGTQFFTAYTEAKPDGLDHVQSQGENTFGFEDFLGGGDNDFNDFVISFDIF